MEPTPLTFGPVEVYLGEKNGKYPDGNQVVVTGKEIKAVFDTPLSANRFPHRLDGADLAILGHVHEDHACGLHLIPDTPLYVPSADREAIRSMAGLMEHYGYSDGVREEMSDYVRKKFHFRPRPDAEGYADGAEWDLGGVRVRAVHMPGHTRGHSVLVVEPAGVVFLGDIDLSGFGPYYGDACSDLEQFRETLTRIAHVEATVWITSHHKGVITEREEFLALLDKFRNRIDERERDICAVLAEGPMTLEGLAAHRFLYPRGYHDIFVEDAERQTIRQHLAILTADGRVAEEDGRYRLCGNG